MQKSYIKAYHHKPMLWTLGLLFLAWNLLAFPSHKPNAPFIGKRLKQGNSWVYLKVSGRWDDYQRVGTWSGQEMARYISGQSWCMQVYTRKKNRIQWELMQLREADFCSSGVSHCQCVWEKNKLALQTSHVAWCMSKTWHWRNTRHQCKCVFDEILLTILEEQHRQWCLYILLVSLETKWTQSLTDVLRKPSFLLPYTLTQKIL